MVSEAGILFWNFILKENIVLYYLLGTVFILVHTPSLRNSYKAGLKITTGLLLSGLIGWWFSSRIPVEYTSLLPGVYFLGALLGISICRYFDELRNNIWGIPLTVLALNPFMGLPLAAVNTSHSSLNTLFAVLGGAGGFYLIYIITAAVKEQISLAETEKEFKGLYTLLIILGILTAVFGGFEFI